MPSFSRWNRSLDDDRYGNLSRTRYSNARRYRHPVRIPFFSMFNASMETVKLESLILGGLFLLSLLVYTFQKWDEYTLLILRDPLFWAIMMIPVMTTVVLFILQIVRHDLFFTSLDVVEAVIIILTAFFFLVPGSNHFRDIGMTRTEQIGGVVTEKINYRDSRQESYSCKPCTKNKDGSESCSTCWRTIYFQHYELRNNSGDWWPGYIHFVENVDEPSRRVPEQWQNAYVGMSVSLPHSYTNYYAQAMLAQFEAQQQIYARYKDVCGSAPYEQVSADQSKHLRTLGFDHPELDSWNFAPRESMSMESWNALYDGWKKDETAPTSDFPLYMDTMFGASGKKIQADIMLEFTNGQPDEIVDACSAFWQRGPKNSIQVFFLGYTDANGEYKVDHTTVRLGLDPKDGEGDSNYLMAERLASDLNNYFAEGGTLDREKVLKIVWSNVTRTKQDGGFDRTQMAKYKGLLMGIHPPVWAYWVSAILILLLDILMKSASLMS